jgi:hypothetical protein
MPIAVLFANFDQVTAIVLILIFTPLEKQSMTFVPSVALSATLPPTFFNAVPSQLT